MGKTGRIYIFTDPERNDNSNRAYAFVPLLTTGTTTITMMVGMEMRMIDITKMVTTVVYRGGGL